MKLPVRQFIHPRSLFASVQDLLRMRRSDVFLLISIICLAAYVLLMQMMLGKLQQHLTYRTELWAERIHGKLRGDIHSPPEVQMMMNVMANADVPTIVIDSAGIPVAWTHISECPDRDATGKVQEKQALECVAKKAKQLRKKGNVSAINDTTLVGYLIMGRSGTIRNLTMLSIALTVLLTCFACIIYVSFHSFRLNERSNLWVALAKETAHQLGTPLTALMGWVEYLRSCRDKDCSRRSEEIIDEIEKICADMDNDLKRLHKISSRFSHIGSVPVLIPCNINEILRDCMDYFQIRLPFIRRKVEMRTQFGEIPMVNANRELLEWVFENLMKNSIDAIQKEAGRIEIRTEYRENEKIVRVYHADNGKGITWEAHKKIFSPGFTTKKRGWGLGLTLAKRIVEDYHQGIIYVHWSKKDKGTVFCVDLPINAKSERSRTLNV